MSLKQDEICEQVTLISNNGQLCPAIVDVYYGGGDIMTRIAGLDGEGIFSIRLFYANDGSLKAHLFLDGVTTPDGVDFTILSNVRTALEDSM